jgi:hypothetical protein
MAPESIARSSANAKRWFVTTHWTVVLNASSTNVAQASEALVNIGSSANDYSPIFSLIDAASPAENPTNAVIDPDRFGVVTDWEEWMRHFAVQRTVGNWDSYGWERGKNDYLYKPPFSGFRHMPWDIDYSLGLGRPADEPLFASNDPRVLAMFNTPAIVRAYWRAFGELVNGPFNNAFLDPFIDSRTAALTNNGVNIDLDAVAAVKTFIGERRAFLQSQLATVAAPFAVSGPLNFSTTTNLIVVRGTAPVAVKEMLLNGVIYPVTWTSPTNFLLRIVLNTGVNDITLQGLDRLGNVIPSAVQNLSVDYPGPIPDPVGALVISEIMFAAAAPGAQFIEIVNRSMFNFDLWGWRLDGVDLEFPPGSVVTKGQTIVLVENKAAFAATYGDVPVFAVFPGSLSVSGEALLLIKPDAAGDILVNGLRYETAPPWPGIAIGASLQLIDLAQDNGRPSNWGTNLVVRATPGAANSIAAPLPPYDPLWLNEIQIVSLTGTTDNFGEADPWLELYNSGPTTLDLSAILSPATTPPT